MADIISTAVALIAAFVLGYGVRIEREKRVTRQPKTIEQLAREQGVKPWAASYEFHTDDPLTDEEFTQFMTAIREVRGGE